MWTYPLTTVNVFISQKYSVITLPINTIKKHTGGFTNVFSDLYIINDSPQKYFSVHKKLSLYLKAKKKSFLF